MHNLAIYGAGGFGRETALLIAQINALKNSWNLTGFYDDGKKKGDLVEGYPILGGIAEAKQLAPGASLVVAIANPQLRHGIINNLSGVAIHYPVLIHPSALTGAELNEIGRGSIVTAGCIFTTSVKIGEFCIINLLTTLGHDVHLQDFCTLMPGCNVSGNVKIGPLSMLGTGVKVLQNLLLGQQCIVGAGAVVIEPVEDFTTVVGVPAKKIKKNAKRI